MLNGLCFPSSIHHLLLTHIELQFDQDGVDHTVYLSGTLYTCDDYFTSMKTAKVNSVDFEIKDWKQF